MCIRDSTYPVRIRTPQRISQQSMRITKKAEPAIILAPNSRLSCLFTWGFNTWFWYCDISVYKNIRIRASTRIRIQKFPLWAAYTEISGYTERIRRTRVDARCIRIKKFADTQISGYLWTGPLDGFKIFHGGTDSTYINSFDKTKFSSTQHHNFLRN